MKFELITLDEGYVKAFEKFDEAHSKGLLYKSYLTEESNGFYSPCSAAIKKCKNLSKNEIPQRVDDIYKKIYAIGIPEEPAYRPYTQNEFLVDYLEYGPVLKRKEDDYVRFVVDVNKESISCYSCPDFEYSRLLDEYEWLNPKTKETYVCGVRV